MGFTAYFELQELEAGDKSIWMVRCAIAWLGFTIVRLYYAWTKRQSDDATERRALCQMFHWVYASLFDEEPGKRLTLFMIDPLDGSRIIPMVRFEPGRPDPQAELNSQARYRRGEGFTGRAWERPGELLFQALPAFADREAFRLYYVETLKIAEEVVKDLSPYMVGVRGIYSYGFKDHTGAMLGVLSVDCDTDEPPGTGRDIKNMLKLVGSVLEAFSYRRLGRMG